MAAERQVRLRFTGDDAAAVLSDLSGVSRDGPWLWVAGDEAPRLERLRVDASDADCYAEHRSYLLGDLVDLPEGPGKEVDLEGLDRAGNHLWLVGSHSRTRKAVEDDDDRAAVDSLRKVRFRPNRHVLIRLPVDDGEPRPGALLDSGVGGLADVLSTDEHLGPFVPIPGKDNGLDVEGIVAVADDTVLVGLRGPVLRGWAVVLELHLGEVPGRPDRLALHDCRKYFLRLGGLGVRDLCRDGDDVVVLAGPTMDLDGPVRLYRWHGGAVERRSSVVRGAQLTRLEVRLPVPSEGRESPEGTDHAEGITLLPGTGQPWLLVVYDSPSDARTGEGGTVLADVVPLPR